MKNKMKSLLLGIAFLMSSTLMRKLNFISHMME